MALARVTYTQSVSGNRNFSVPFPYLSKDHVKVTVNGAAVTFSWLSASSIQLTTAPAIGAKVEVRRVTERNSLLVDFADGSTLTESQLDLANKQNFYLSQEADDLAVESNGIANTALTTANTALTTANTAQTQASSAVSTANSANTKATAAQTTAANAETVANTANTKATSALSSSASAVSTANAASSKADSALTTANQANNAAASAVSTANAAKTQAETADSNASTAVTTANSAMTRANSALDSSATAVTTANQANSKATSAVSTADTARNTADAANTKATNAVNTANAANATANTALSTANAAKTQAEAAEAAATTATSTANEAISKADLAVQNSANASYLANQSEIRAQQAEAAAQSAAGDAATAVNTASQLEVTVNQVLQSVQDIAGGDLSDFAKNSENLSALTDKVAARQNLGLGNVDNTRDIDKPVSTAVQTALNGKANSAHTHPVSQVTGLGTAATATLIASPYDRTAGRVPTVGYGGIGLHLDQRNTALERNTTVADLLGRGTVFGFARGGSDGLGIPALGITPNLYGVLMTCGHWTDNSGSTAIMRVFFFGPRVFRQWHIGGGNWSAWQEDYNEGNLDWGTLKNKPTTFAPSTHTHAIADVTGLQEALDGKAATSHTHAISNITGLQNALNAASGLAQGGSAQDPNAATAQVILSNHVNTPNSAFYWHITTSFYANISATANRGQIAVQYNGGNQVYARSFFNNVWTAWVRLDNGSLGTAATKNITVSTAAPSGGNDGDVWIQY